MEGTNKGQDNGEAMALVGVRLTDQLGSGRFERAKVLRYSPASLNWMFNSMPA
ncbi:hypothetical protein [Aquabacterium sp. NJ1]|uniref:hypothetical protein n=1 Tax=Aquabacterium sp. NJ1 TaxID=1538295 RepID=UPI0013766202|nr:hypothetical protein [Aquabacterium sp. NJ1]